jgi:hypothetical protein
MTLIFAGIAGRLGRLFKHLLGLLILTLFSVEVNFFSANS